MKRFFSLLLVAAMILGIMPGVFATESTDTPDNTPLTEEDYVLADLIWAEVNAKEESMLAKKAPVSKTVDALIATVTESPYYAEDSLIRNGDHFFWETTDGIACGYSPRLSAIAEKAEPSENYETAPATLTYDYSTKGTASGSKDVFVIQPYYGIDKDFTNQYVTESQNIAKDLGGTATVYRTANATIDTIADAMEQGNVVIFDSHGDTDYANGDDYATRANTSYICLQYGTGITSKDMEPVVGPFGTYYHAFYGGSYNEMKYYCVDGTAIANHMEKKAPQSLLWMALCLGMATDGLHKPLTEKGVAVSYGYSQSVTFDYDYLWEEVFWDEMIANKTVSQAIAAMKEEVGLWDWCHSKDYDTITEARNTYCAFPIVVSAQDPYPGHGKVDDLQTVRSTWVLCPHSYSTTLTGGACTAGGYTSYLCTLCGYSYNEVLPATGHSYTATVTPPSCEGEGYTTYTCSACGHSYQEDAIPATGHSYTATVTPPSCEGEGYTAYTCSVCGHSYQEDVIPATGHSYTATVTPPSCEGEGYTTYTCANCNHSYVAATTPPTGHIYENGSCTQCGRPNLPENPFVDVEESAYFGYPVLWALDAGITTGTSATTFGPEKTCTRGQVVTFLWRAYGCPEPMTTENPFSDISPDAYYYKAVLWAVEEGITQGTGKGKFSPDKGCTRGQVATFLWRAQDEPTPENTDNPFSDVAEGDYYYTAVLWAVENNITQGTGKGKFSPDNSCTRGQIVTFLYRALA